ncbi:membrane protein insertase YidC [Nocardioides sp. WS12]|uniref:membrane protein insertase YidC n=1 Tax=Nocardioides sp. WS12 TaxID=2486272 RepID=UPI0015FAF81E|nr:membrane protein insertase YidC [Nocardioides sp. WS12]
MSLLDPLIHALAAVVAATHAGLTHLGADPAAGSTWLLCIATVVVTVRVALLPLVVHGVRNAHSAARARPHLKELADRYRHRKDAASLREHLEERRRISAEHGVSRLGCLPVLVQLPLWVALYHLLAGVAGGTPVGAMDTDLVGALGTATLLAVPLAARGYLGGGPVHLAVVAGLALLAAGLSFVTQRYFVATNTVLDGMPDGMAAVQQMMPVISAVGLLVAGGFVPTALLVYWICNSTWTLGQTFVVWRWFPTPGTPAARRRATPA